MSSSFATVGTDTGHKGHGLTADWALYGMERQLNFGHLAVHRTAVVSHGIIGEYYCQSAVYSYFFGCSRGGGQALIEAQRYSEGYDLSNFEEDTRYASAYLDAPSTDYSEFKARDCTCHFPEEVAFKLATLALENPN